MQIANDFLERPTTQKLESKEDLTVMVDRQLVNRRNAGMFELPGDLRLLDKAREVVGIFRQVFLDQPIESQVKAYPEFGELFERRDQLEQQVDNIKMRRSDLAPEDYRRELERLLIDLARVSSIIRNKTQ